MLHIEPLTRDQANAMVASWHRHHKPVTSHRFSLGVFDDAGAPHGAVIVGRPVSGGPDQYLVAEVTRLVTDGTPNACSMLYGAAARAAQAMGFARIQTYILADESGTSLRASGWQLVRMSHPVGWHHDGVRGSRAVERHLSSRKQLWARELNTRTSHGVVPGVNGQPADAAEGTLF